LGQRLGREITREFERLAQLQAQIVEIERERDNAPTPCVATDDAARASLRPAIGWRGLPWSKRHGLWLRHQPDSALTRWFHERTAGQSKHVRCIMIIALAPKLAIALWRYLETGLVPEGAVVK
jgi:hypothetical protein